MAWQRNVGCDSPAACPVQQYVSSEDEQEHEEGEEQADAGELDDGDRGQQIMGFGRHEDATFVFVRLNDPTYVDSLRSDPEMSASPEVAEFIEYCEDQEIAEARPLPPYPHA